MKDFATYEKIIESKLITTKHIIRIRLNSDRVSIENALKNVPYSAKVAMIVDDSELENWGEIVFTDVTADNE